MPSTDAQDRIIKQLEDRYERMECCPQPDGSLKITAYRMTVGATEWVRVVTVAPNGHITHDEPERSTT